MTAMLEDERIFRYEVPVDGQWHALKVDGAPLHVGCRKRGVVEFWAPSGGLNRPGVRRFIVVGTGHPLPAGSLRYHGTAMDGPLVWHLIEGGDTEATG